MTAEGIVDGEAQTSPVARLVPGDSSDAHDVDLAGRLEAALERQTCLREAADRALAKFREDHEDAFERLTVRCRALEGEKAKWVEAGLSSPDDVARIRAEHRETLARRTAEAERASLERVGGLEQRVAEVEQEAARSKQLLVAERDRAFAERDRAFAERDRSAVEREGERLAAEEQRAVLSQTLAAAEERFRMDAVRLSTVATQRQKEVEAALAEAAGTRTRAAEERAGREAAQRQLAEVIASTSWKLGRPMRVAARLLRRVLGRVPGRGA